MHVVMGLSVVSKCIDNLQASYTMEEEHATGNILTSKGLENIRN